MAHPKSAVETVLPTVHAYVAETVERVGLARALPILEQAVSIWDATNQPRLSLAFRQAIARAKAGNLRVVPSSKLYTIRQLVVVADESGEGIEEIVESWPLANAEGNGQAIVASMAEAKLYIESALRDGAEVEDLGEGFFRIEGAKPDQAGIMTMWQVEEQEPA